MEDWFKVDRKGLAKLLADKGRAFVVFELLSNAWDEASSRVDVSIEPVDGSASVTVRVTDDNPSGFRDLSHAFTLFAQSAKASDAGKRGRFNLGEKLVLACCTEASISSTTGTVEFTADGRHERRTKRDAGTEFSGRVRMTRAELAEALEMVRRVIPPAGVVTTLNGDALLPRTGAVSIPCTLPTVLADVEGNVRSTTRKTTVDVYDVPEGRPGWIYELGIPVVETGDRWDYDVRQKVPLAFERDNVTPGYLRALRTAVANEMAARGCLDARDGGTRASMDALADSNAAPETVRAILVAKYGEKYAIYDPSDREANNALAAEGYALIHGSSLSREQWEVVRATNAAQPAGQIRPTPMPFSGVGRQLKTVPPDEWTDLQRAFVTHAVCVGRALLGFDVGVTLADDRGWRYRAAYGDRHLTVNVATCRAEFADIHGEAMLSLLIHEFAHEIESNHLDKRFHDACCTLGARLALAMARGAFKDSR